MRIAGSIRFLGATCRWSMRRLQSYLTQVLATSEHAGLPALGPATRDRLPRWGGSAATRSISRASSGRVPRDPEGDPVASRTSTCRSSR
jgi:hypothetical protein